MKPIAFQSPIKNPTSEVGFRVLTTSRGHGTVADVTLQLGVDSTTGIRTDANPYRSGTDSPESNAVKTHVSHGAEWPARQKTPVARGNSQQSNSVPVATVVGLVSGKLDRARIEANTGPKGLWPSQCNPREWWKRMADRESPISHAWGPMPERISRRSLV
jgi:hypothetical protein